MRTLRTIILIGATALFLCYAIGSFQKKVALRDYPPRSNRSFEQLVHTWIKPGTTQGDAIHALQDHLFHVYTNTYPLIVVCVDATVKLENVSAHRQTEVATLAFPLSISYDWTVQLRLDASNRVRTVTAAYTSRSCLDL